jgi:hypothetical protein
LRQLAHLARFAFPDKSARIRRFQPLPNNSGNFCAGAFSQCFEFVERFVAANPRLGTKFDPNQDGALVMLMGNVVGLSQMITSIAENLTIKPIRYHQSSVRHVLYLYLRERSRSGAGEGAWIQLDASALTRPPT